MKRLVKEKKDRCWQAFCEDPGLQSPCKVVRWARDPWWMSDKIGRLRGSNGVWLEGDGARVEGLVRNVFGVLGPVPVPCGGGCLEEEFPYSRDEVRG